MDSVQRFVSENHHQLGYIMQEASRQWKEKDNIGALTVGDCNFFIEKYGQYHEILENMKEYEKTLKEIASLHVLDRQLADAQYIALLALKTEGV